ncbi:MAG: phage tail tube protein [Thalassobaculum sp.]|uniref:phage tail tube protein n=1 Tax=Thalassobaculum sp. TaxID=2022740 RepID=UPI0032EE6254
MADSSRAQLYYLAESTWGETPVAALTEMRFTGESLGFQIQNTTSREVRADRQVADLIQTGAEAAGSVELELSYGAHDPLLAAALFSAWGTPVAVSVADDIAASNAGSSFTSTATDFAAAGIAVGQWLRVGGFAASGGANDGYYRVTSVAAGALGVSPAPALDEAAAGLTVEIAGTLLRNGVTETSFTLEKRFPDVGQMIAFAGMVPGSFGLDIRTGAVITGSVGFTGRAATIGAASVGTGAPVAASTNPVMNAVGHVGDVREDGVLMPDAALRELSVRLDNGLRGVQAVGSLGNVDVGAGRCTVTGRVSVYFADGALYAKYLAGTPTSLSFRVTDADGNGYVVTLPRVKLVRGSIVAGGNDQDVLADFDLQALRDPVTGCTLQIDRFAA